MAQGCFCPMCCLQPVQVLMCGRCWCTTHEFTHKWSHTDRGAAVHANPLNEFLSRLLCRPYRAPTVSLCFS